MISNRSLHFINIMITEIQTNFYRITLPMPYRLRHVHIYALVQGTDVVLFDTGMNMPGSYELLETDLTSIGLSTKSIRDVFITHSHTDHCSMAGLLQARTPAKIHISAAADNVYQHFHKAELLIHAAKLFYARHGMSPQEVDAMVEEIDEIRSIIAPFNADDHLKQNEIREFGDWKFEVIFTPGHAAGHVCFFFRAEGFLLAGDHVLPYIAPSLSPNIFDEIFQPLKDYLDSLQIVERLPVTTIYPGHGNSFTNISERAGEIRTHHELRKQVVFQCLNTRPKTTYAISAEIIGAVASRCDDWEKFMALNETYVYLQELKREGVIKETTEGNVVAYKTI
jgi:glyoxylase-like metal-dependent hydrolase (beta-lactamase superfamily II)